MQPYSKKCKSYWCTEYHNSKVHGHIIWRFYIYRRITWLDPTPEFIEDIRKRFRYTKGLSYSSENNRLYLYTEERRITYWIPIEPDEDSPCTFLHNLRVKGRIIKPKGNL